MRTPQAARLLKKYAWLQRLREESSDGGNSTQRSQEALQALSTQFPGALRELGQMQREEIYERQRLLVSFDHAVVLPLWVSVTDRYHQLLRGALEVKRWLRGRRQVEEKERLAFFSTYSSEDNGFWQKQLTAVAQPPQGRMMGLVLRRLETEFSLSEEAVRSILFAFQRDDGPLLLPVFLHFPELGVVAAGLVDGAELVAVLVSVAPLLEVPSLLDSVFFALPSGDAVVAASLAAGGFLLAEL